MARPVLIMGKSGSGKSASLRNFKPEEVDIVNVIGKELPFRNEFKNVFQTDDYAVVLAAIKKSSKPVVVVDDAGYLITNQFMKNHAVTGGGNAVFSLYNSLADNFWGLINATKAIPDPDKIVYFMMHEEKDDFGEVKPKTMGKLLNEKVCVEGLFTIVLRAEKSGDDYVFNTRTTGLDVTKSPIGMFENEKISNDLKAVDTTIREYYGMGKGEKHD